MPELQQLQEQIGYSFQDEALLRLALTHPSVAHEQGTAIQHNQRLEFLGDSVLGLILTRELYEKFPDFGEGPLTKARAQMVNRHTLAVEAQRLNLGDYLILSKGEEANRGRGRASALADAFEAVLGAMFLDGGLDVVKAFVLRSFRDAFGELQVIPNLDNPKGELQELLQADSSEAPQYLLLSVAGPDHDRDFYCVVQHAGLDLGRGVGKSKKAAESAAALEALKELRRRKAEAGREPTTENPEMSGESRTRA